MVFVGDTTCLVCEIQVELPGPDSWEQLPEKNRRMWAPALARFPAARAFVKVDMDAYYVVENLYEALALYEERQGRLPDYLGSEYTFMLGGESTPLRYCSGGAGYVVSRRAAEALAKCTLSHAYEDVQTGWCLRDAGYAAVHHHGFIGDDLSMALMCWLRSPEFENHNAETHVPAAIISIHGYKNSYAFAGLDILTRARAVGSLRHRVGPPPVEPVEARGIDIRTAFDVCCVP